MNTRAIRGSASLLGAAVLAALVIAFPNQAEAVPAFARQTNMSCVACHSQAFPAINAFGRAFKAGGYTLVSGQPLIEGEDMSLPSALNMSVVLKLRYAKTNGDSDTGTDRGQIQWPDEAALLIGGRLAEDVGFLIEAGLAGLPGSGEVDPLEEFAEVESTALLSSKLHFNVADYGATQFSVIPYSTDGLGVGYGFELLNTGAMRAQRPIEFRTGFSAAQALGVASGPATGAALVASNPRFFLNYTPWTPGFDGENFDIGSSFAHYLRGAWMPQFGGWDTGLGFQYLTGSARPSDEDGNREDLETDSWVIDAQTTGMAAKMPLSLFASYGTADAGTIFNVDDGDAKAYAVMGQLGVLPNKANVYLGYRTLDSGTAIANKANAVTVGGQYLLRQNVRMELYHVAESGSAVRARANRNDALTVLQLFSAF